jgi:hypothetical protein
MQILPRQTANETGMSHRQEHRYNAKYATTDHLYCGIPSTVVSESEEQSAVGGKDVCWPAVEQGFRR